MEDDSNNQQVEMTPKRANRFKADMSVIGSNVKRTTNIARQASDRSFDPSPENSMSAMENVAMDGREALKKKQMSMVKAESGELVIDPNIDQLFEHSGDGLEQQATPRVNAVAPRLQKKETFKDGNVKKGQESFQSDEAEDGLKKKFKPYNDIIKNLTLTLSKDTEHDIQSCIITHDSSRIICVLQVSDEHTIINQYDTLDENYKISFSHDLKGHYIKAKDVIQDKFGMVFCCPYFDNGVYKLLIFNRFEIISDFNINEAIDLDDKSRSNDNFQDPLVTATFVKNNNIFVSLFHSKTFYQYTFTFSFLHRKIMTVPQQTALDPTLQRNFPLKTFWDSDRNFCYIFYRQGQSFAVNLENDINEVREQRLTTQDFGDIFFYNNNILIMKSSAQILFFKLMCEENTLKKTHEFKWKCYEKLDIQGFIYNIPDSNAIHIITDTLIYFYRLENMENKTNSKSHTYGDDPHESFMPRLESVMYNFMQATSLQIDKNNQICLTYKQGQPGFEVYKRKYDHGFHEMIESIPREGTCGVNYPTKNIFCISDDDYVQIHNEATFQVIKQVKVPLKQSDEDNLYEILKIRVSQDEQYLAVLAGKNLPKEIEEIHQLFIFKLTPNDDDYTLLFKIDLPEEYRNISMAFDFRAKEQESELLMCDQDGIIMYNYFTQKEERIHDFANKLQAQPDFSVWDSSQSFGILASTDDVLWFDVKNKREVDIDDVYQLGDIKSLFYHNKKFYVLANKYQRRLGYFLLELNENLWGNTEKPRYIIKWENKLEIGDAGLDKIEVDGEQCLIVSYKSIHINSYSIVIVSIATGKVKLWHDNYQLWESPVFGFLNSYSNDFIVLNKEGTSFIPLGQKEKRAIYNPDGTERMVHSLQSCKYLRCEDSNLIKFDRPNQGALNRVISIQEQIVDDSGSTSYKTIFQINVDEMTLRELIQIQSLFLCDFVSEIEHIIHLQPNPALFFRSFMELNQANMIQILAFESRIIRTLLETEKFEFNSDYPIFYRVRQNLDNEIRIVSAVDISLEDNQIKALNLIIKYIVEYQNDISSNCLFNLNLIQLIEKGIEVADLLHSDIFCHRFEMPEWPLIHTMDTYISKPYNGSIFQLQDKYHSVFGNMFDASVNVDQMRLENQISGAQSFRGLTESKNNALKDGIENKPLKVYKIQYTLNLLPLSTYQDGESFLLNDLLSALGESDELELFNCDVVKDFIDFQWGSYAKFLHYFGGAVHLLYVLLFMIYTNYIYLDRYYESRVGLIWAMFICLLYPLVYDGMQFIKQGPAEYFSDFWNFLDQGHIWIGFVNLFIQRFQPDILSHTSQIMMLIVCTFMLIKSFFFMRMFTSLSFLVKMIMQVFYDLKVFLLFFVILIYLFAMFYAIIDMANFVMSDDPDLRAVEASPFAPEKEYDLIPRFMAQLFIVLRISLGNFDYGSSTYMPEFGNHLYWFTFLTQATVMRVVFMNFIIAEVTNSYTCIMEVLDPVIMQERCNLINESEDMLRARFGTSIATWKHLFPKYIITRQTVH